MPFSCWFAAASMSHQVKNNVDAEGIAALLGKFVEEPIVFALALPTVAVVTIVGGDDHDAALVVEDGADVHLTAILLVAILVGVKILPGKIRGMPPGGHVDGRCLQFVFGTFDVEHAMEDRM